MCTRVDCPRCGRPTYAGCGRHVEQVLGNVPPAARCRCREERATPASGTAERGLRSRLRALFGK